ncbi:hypothetical protein RHMOL_Rhmol11G0225100 [Rhododendron molle]|uniref:Uncharacterized protein n=1 Tax=Rhododendron molle TaxID=49168 RepID=A0ACC0LW97_RHOML|nr:hypothetical protein RHMOL_Rhmol11G0225100 [Rhododendron molle]
MAKKPSMGRRKIKIAKIEIKNHLQVTFSKRRSGLFKKASELCTLCGVEIAIVVYSPAGKVFSFGHPNVDSITDQFLSRSPPPNSTMRHLIEAHRNASVRDLNSQLAQLLSQLEIEKKRGETIDHKKQLVGQRKFWWEKPIDELGLNALEQLRDSMEELKKNATDQANKLLGEGTINPSRFFIANDVIGMVDSVETNPYQIDIGSSTNPDHVHNFGYGHGCF